MKRRLVPSLLVSTTGRGMVVHAWTTSLPLLVMLKSRRRGLSILVVLLQIRDNQQIINFDENIIDSLGKPRYYCGN